MARGISRLHFELSQKSGHDFQNLFGSILSSVLDGAAQSKKLGILDQAGVDAFVIKPDEVTLQTVVQCKGFEVIEYGLKQHVQCRAEIKKYASLGLFTPEYWLVINRPIKDRAMREQLLVDLRGLVDGGKAAKAELLDSSAMQSRLRELAKARIKDWGDTKRSELFNFYTERLQFVEYLANVPFNANRTRPVDFIDRALNEFVDALPRNQSGKYRRAPAFIVTSGFGFGKTSTLHAVARQWMDSNRFVIYAPAALLDGNAFYHTAGLAEAILKFLIPDDVELSDLAHDFYRDVLRSTLASSKDWLLLIDGLDESPWAFNTNSLASLWGSIGDLGIPSVISARDELVENRKAEFFPNSRLKIAPSLQRVSLDDWPDPLILQFVLLFALRRGNKEPDGFRRFRELIEKGQYDSVYGDIPKRPLFLGMLAEDAWSGHEPERQVHRLYGKYFRLKLEYDRWSLAAGGASRRPSEIVDALGLEEATERLLHVMQDASEFMFSSADNDISLSKSARSDELLAEAELRKIADRNRIPFAQVEDILLHSLLQPAGRDSQTRQRQTRFAHRSFQDWFLARAFVEGRKDGNRLAGAVKRFFDAISADVAMGGSLP